ncbi:MAG TPA: arginine--tRNA ligase [Solirubrobacteraceae bacterium]|nr:arginine--tRNA ligase [Solirubrobacteraceae bacterium]
MNPIATETGLREIVLALAGELAGGAGARQAIALERPPQADFGDYSTNAALLLAPAAGIAPRELAERLGEALARRLGERLERFEVAGPGFLNLFLADIWHCEALAAVLAAGEGFGRGGAAVAERIVVEFVSANPTGPMHVGHARNAAYGDALARALAFHGHTVEREFYVNDAGSQVRKLGESVRALARGEEVPEDGYHGDYVVDLAAELADASAMESAELGRAAVAVMMARIARSLSEFRVEFDSWSYESALHEGTPSPVAHTLSILERHGHTYRSEGALWLRTTEYGDDKDRVLVRSSGEHTYFASDIAYHQDKRERGFDRQIDVWGADHHGYVGRMKAAYEALGGDPEHVEMLIMQLVHLVRRGERAQMSKRAGEFVTLEDLLREIGVDAARWFLLSRSHDTTIDLDLDLAREQSSENPVYYVQYAHARIASMLAKAGAEQVELALASAGENFHASLGDGSTGDGSEGSTSERSEGLHPAERALVNKLLAFPGEVREAAGRRAPHRIAAYGLELAQQFTAFYRDCRVLGAGGSDGGQSALESRRLALCVASQRTIARALDLLGVQAPAEM